MSREWIVKIGISSIFVILGLYFSSMPARSVPLPDSSRHLRIASINLLYENEDRNGIFRAVDDLKADIVFFLECTPWNHYPEDWKSSGYQLVIRESRRGTHGVCVVAKDLGEVASSLVESPVDGPCSIPIGTVRVPIEDGHLGILAVHAPPPIEICEETTESTILAVSSWVEGGELITSVGSLLQGDSVVVLGDFNSLPWSQGVDALESSGLIDAFPASSEWFGPTWSPVLWFPSFLRIDYLFSPSSIPAEGAWTVRIPGSDHRAVVVDLLARAGA